MVNVSSGFQWIMFQVGFNGQTRVSSLCFEWVSIVELGFNGLCFKWVSIVELGFNGLFQCISS